jgi:translation initiation factor 1
MDLRDQLKNLFLNMRSRISKCLKKSLNKKVPLCVSLKKGRNGKPVTLIEGFEGGDAELKEISKKSKPLWDWWLRKRRCYHYSGRQQR